MDDNRDAADILADALREVGYEVEAAYDGPSALARAAAFRPQFGLLDIGLPAMDGYELAARMRAQATGWPLTLFAVTGYGQSRDRERTRAAGFAGHVVKPVDLAAVCALLEGQP